MVAIPECILSRLEEPLTPEQEEAVQQGKVGFEANDAHAGTMLCLRPSAWGAPSYWIWTYSELSTGIQHYSPKSTSADRIPWGMFEVGGLRVCPSSQHDTWPPKQKKSKFTKKKTNLYVIQSEAGGPFKVGVSEDVASRLSQLQTGSPFKLKVIDEYNGVSFEVEKKVHEELKKYRLHGEWFEERALGLVEGIVKKLSEGDNLSFCSHHTIADVVQSLKDGNICIKEAAYLLSQIKTRAMLSTAPVSKS